VLTGILTTMACRPAAAANGHGPPETEMKISKVAQFRDKLKLEWNKGSGRNMNIIQKLLEDAKVLLSIHYSFTVEIHPSYIIHHTCKVQGVTGLYTFDLTTYYVYPDKHENFQSQVIYLNCSNIFV